MDRPPKIGTKLRAVFAVLVVVTVSVTLTSVVAVRLISDEEQRAAMHAARLVGISHLSTQAEHMAVASRAYLLSGDARSLDSMHAADASFVNRTAELRRRLPARDAADMLDDVESSERAYVAALQAITARRPSAGDPAALAELQDRIRAPRGELLETVTLLRRYEERQSKLAERLASRDTRRVLTILLAIAVAALAASGALAVVLTRTFRALAQRQRERDDYLTRLQAANRDLDAFAGRIAHDLRNSLAPVTMWCAALRRSGGDRESAERIVERVDRSAKKMLALLDGLLAFSRAGGPPDASASTSVAAVVADVVEALAELATEVDATIDGVVPDVRVACSAELLHLLLTNLVQNALKFLRGRRTRRVHIAAAARGDGRCEIVVEDSGPGMAPEAIGHVFEPFYRVPGVTVAGTGIGLATVRRIVEAHGGRADVESWPGVGSRFTVQLPLAGEPATHSSGERPALHLSAAAHLA